MDTDRGLQEVVSRNVRVLMAVHDITSQKDLVERLGDHWDSPKLTRSLNGSRRWSLEDLPTIARVFNVTPALLLSDTAELVGASGPTAAVSRGRSSDYRGTNDALILTFPQASGTPRRFRHRSTAHTTRRVTPGGERRLGTAESLSDASVHGVTPVTAAVGS